MSDLISPKLIAYSDFRTSQGAIEDRYPALEVGERQRDLIVAGQLVLGETRQVMDTALRQEVNEFLAGLFRTRSEE